MKSLFKQLAVFLGLLGFTLMSLSSHGIQPLRNYINDLDSIAPGIKWKEFTVLAGNHIELNLWHVQPLTQNQNNDKLIIIAYSDKGNLSYYALHAAALAKGGFQVVLFDYRGFGKSTPYTFDEEYLYLDFFKDDLLQVMDWTAQNCKYKRRGIMAFSMGSIISQMAVREQRVDFMIYDGFILNPIMAANRIKDIRDDTIPVPESAFDFERKMKKIKIPSLIFAGTEDKITTISDVIRYAKKRKNRKTITYPGGHNSAFKVLTEYTFGDLVVRDISKFVNR